jgi:tetraacyldisaccharide 4'-kinase
MIETYWRHIIEKRNGSPLAFCVRIVLSILALVYRAVVAVRNYCYDRGIKKPYRLPVPVIGIGNIVMGGTGKSPCVRLVAEKMAAGGRRVAIVSRGYGAPRRKTSYPIVVSDGTRTTPGAYAYGDEPAMLAEQLHNCIVIVDPHRVRGGAFAVERYGADVIILDDAFQHRRIFRNLDILLLDCAAPFGNGRLIPAGHLREPAGNAARADVILLTRCETSPGETTVSAIRAVNPRAPLITSRHIPIHVRTLPDGPRIPIQRIANKKTAIFCGIARPHDFASTLEKTGATIVWKRFFPDHHYFSRQEMESVAAEAVRAGAETVITTEKDAVRIPPGVSWPLPVYALVIELNTGRDGDKLLESVLHESLKT